MTARALLCALAMAMCGEALAQYGICRPVSQRTEELGCWIIAVKAIGKLPPGPVFWHLDTYPSRVAAQADVVPHATIVESLGKVWLLTIAGAGWRPAGGERVAQIGPLPLARPDASFTTVYYEAIFTPGMTAPTHRHSGPEAWHTLSGETCLETPEGKFVGRAGGPPVIVPEGLPMHLTATGTAQRRALVLILHDSSQPASTPAPDWTPKGLCKS